MPNLLAMSFEGHLAPSFDLHCLEHGHKLPDGWGVGFYPGGEPSATVLKEPVPALGSMRSELVKAWQHLESSLFMCHIRAAMWGSPSDANTQPFCRTWGGRDWLFTHAGSLRHRLSAAPGSPFEPVGSTDTEEIFCELLTRIAKEQWRSLGEANLTILHHWLTELNALGTLSIAISDGNDLVVYADKTSEPEMYLWRLIPPQHLKAFGDADLSIDLVKRDEKSRKGVVVCTNLLDTTPPGGTKWEKLAPGQLVALRQGSVRADLPPIASGGADQQAESLVRGRKPPAVKQLRRVVVTHRTTYRYEKPVERSTHYLRLTPMHDRHQALLDSSIGLSVDGRWFDYDDVFGNRVRRVFVESPYSEFTVTARSTVELRETQPVLLPPFNPRPLIPAVWMPWQRHMLQPYMLPPELAETELAELLDYAMSFARRNDHDLLDTLLDMNSSIYEDYKYVQGSTNLATSAFDVYATRRGVCQDFANLFICLAQLLGVPARYVCGYLYTGPAPANRAMAEASHAWAQIYLPDVGWRGFDPTSGIVTQTDHIRVAVGRSYRDATPTAGTLFVGGGHGTLEVDVTVTAIE